MMLMNSLKAIGTISFISLLLVASGWWGLSRSMQAQPVASTSNLAPTPPVQLDLSTPEKALESYCNALKAGDRSATYACTTIDANTPPTAGDAFLSLNLAQNHLIRSAAHTFGTDGQEARKFITLDSVLSQILAYDQMTQQSATITGDTAALPFNLPDAVLRNLPDNVQAQVRSFMGHPIHFIKQGNDWKLGSSAKGSSRSLSVKITLTDTNNHPVGDSDLQIKVVNEYAAIYNQIADSIDAGLYTSWDNANTALKAQVEQLHKKYGLSDIDIKLSPSA